MKLVSNEELWDVNDWMSLKNCSPEVAHILLNASGRNREAQLARQICDECVVQEPCLQYMIENKLPGFGGGVSFSERKAMIKAAKIAVQSENNS